MIGHPGVDIVTFTGSEGVGRHIGEVAGRNLVPVALELGGKSACVVLDDADLELAVTTCVMRCMLNTGQTCIALDPLARSTRAARPRPRRSPPRSRRRTRWVIPFDPATKMGPLVSARQRDRSASYIRARHRGRRAAGHRRRRTARRSRPRLFRRADRLLRRAQRHDDRPGGDLRAGPLDHRVRRRGGRDPDRQRLALRTVGRGVVGRRAARACASRGGCAPDRSM